MSGPDPLADGPFAGLPRNHFGVLYADPPWAFTVRSDKGKGRSAEQHYGCMTKREILDLPVGDLAARDCVLFLWVTDPMLRFGMDVIEAWGFTYKTVGFNWAKLNRDGTPFCGMGFWTRANPELCLLATRGNPKRVGKDVRRLITAPRREHSRKPDEVRERIERLVSGPYCEMWARQVSRGWSSWGNELDKFHPAEAIGTQSAGRDIRP